MKMVFIAGQKESDDVVAAISWLKDKGINHPVLVFIGAHLVD